MWGPTDAQLLLLAGGWMVRRLVPSLRQFLSPHIRLCLSEDILKAGGPLYLLSVLILEKDNCENQ